MTHPSRASASCVAEALSMAQPSHPNPPHAASPLRVSAIPAITSPVTVSRDQGHVTWVTQQRSRDPIANLAASLSRDLPHLSQEEVWPRGLAYPSPLASDIILVIEPF